MPDGTTTEPRMSRKEFAAFLRARVPELRSFTDDNALVEGVLKRRPDLASRIQHEPEAEQGAKAMEQELQRQRIATQRIPQTTIPFGPGKGPETYPGAWAPTAAEREAAGMEMMRKGQQEAPALYGTPPETGARPKGFFRNLFLTEPHEILKAATGKPTSVAGYEPPNLRPLQSSIEAAKAGKLGEAVASASSMVPVVGSMASARAAQGKEDPWGAAGASVVDVAALALPFLLGGDAKMEPVQIEQASKLLADSLADESLSPHQYATRLQSGFDQIIAAAGKAKGDAVSLIERDAPTATVKYANTLSVLRTEVSNLRDMKARNPLLFSQGEALDKTLKILEEELESTASEASAGLPGNIRKADTRRSQYYLYRMQLDPSLASRVVKMLNKALTEDISAGVGEVNPELANRYIAASNRYHQISVFTRAKTFEKIFGDKRMEPDKVVGTMYANPEESLRVIRTLYEGDPRAIQALRRTLFEYGMQRGSLGPLPKLTRMQDTIMREVFGPQADAIQEFVKAIQPTAQPANPILKFMPGKTGALAKLLVMDPSGKMPIQISREQMNKILQSSNAARLATQAARMPVTAGPAKSVHAMLIRMLPALGVISEQEKGEP